MNTITDTQLQWSLIARFQLTQTESTISTYISIGKTQAEIRSQFNLTENALKQHLKAIYGKILSPEIKGEKYVRLLLLLLNERYQLGIEFNRYTRVS